MLRGEQYERLQPTTIGRLESTVYPGLWLNVAALLQGEMLIVLNDLQQGLATPEHAAFVKALASAAKPAS